MTTPSDQASTATPDACEDRCDVEIVHADAVRAAQTRVPGEEAIHRAVETASLLANPTRLRILAALAPDQAEPDPRLCVCDLAYVVAASETATSHQLRALRLAGLVEQRREGRLVYYRLSRDPGVRRVVAALVHGATG